MKLELETERQEKLFETAVFFGKLLVFGAVFQIVLALSPNTLVLQKLFAGLNTLLLQLLGFNATWSGIDILIDAEIYRITRDCLGWKSVMAFTGLVLASKPRLEDLKNLFIGATIILTANIIRIITTIILSNAGIISFEIVHGFLWRWGLTAATLAMWFYWFRSRKLLNKES